MRFRRWQDWSTGAKWATIGGTAGALLWLLRKAGRLPPMGTGTGSAVPTESCSIDLASPRANSEAARVCQTPFPESLADRNAYILSKVSRGEYYVDWVPISSTAGGHTATFWVMGDALKVDGVRVMVDATTEQRIADMVGGMLLTPKLADLIFMQSNIRLPPMPHSAWVESGTMTTTAHMVEQSKLIDAAIVKQVGSIDDAAYKIVSTVGKHWVITNELGRAKAGKAQNYGWHMVGTSGEAAVTNAIDPKTGKPLRVIQGPGLAHDRLHTDYSQNCVLVAKRCIVDGRDTTLSAVLSAPALAPLASHQGVVRTLRQPGVPEYTGVA